MTVTNSKLAEQSRAKLVGWVLEQTDPVAVAQAAGWMIDQLNDVRSEIAQHRTVAVRQLQAEGWSLAEIGAALGITRARVDQIANR